MKKKIFISMGVIVLAIFAMMAVGSNAPVATAAEKIYNGTLYISSMGGFMVKADVAIDPTNEQPIQLTKDLTRQFLMENQNIAISKKYYATHDPRIDHDRNVMFWSAYFMDDRDPANKVVHAGKIDLATGKILADIKIPTDPRQKAAIQYCGSGQTKDKYLIVLMGYESWIDIIDKDTMKHEKRVFFEPLHEKEGLPKGYLWTHGINSPDMKEFALWMTLTDDGGKFPRGEETRQMIFILDMKSLLNGKIKVLRKGTITSDPKRSAFFRGYYTNDGKYILTSNRDRVEVFDAKTLKQVSTIMHPMGWENHDAFPTPDGKYMILTQRVPVDNLSGQEPPKVMDGMIELIDLSTMKRIGKPTSVCMSCHKGSQALPWAQKYVPAVVCGIDGVWKK